MLQKLTNITFLLETDQEELRMALEPIDETGKPGVKLKLDNTNMFDPGYFGFKI
jgi:hypothetical protein